VFEVKMASEQYLLNFINAYYNKKLGWEEASRQVVLSEELIEKYKDKVDWNNIFINQSLSKEFKDKYLHLTTLDNRYFKYCFICEGINIQTYYRKDEKRVRDCKNRWSYKEFFYCSKCLR